MWVENLFIVYYILFYFEKNLVLIWVLRCWRKELPVPSLSSLTALHWSVVLFLNELRHHWRDRPLPICANLLCASRRLLIHCAFTHSPQHQMVNWSYTNQIHGKNEEEEKQLYLSALQTWRDIMKATWFIYIFFWAAITQRATDVGSSTKSLRVKSNARFLCILTGMLNVRAHHSHSLQARARQCACVQLPQLRVSDVKN